MLKSLAAGIALLSLVAIASAADGPPPATAPTTPQQRQLAAWWEDLKSADPAASRALLAMASTPDETVAFLKTHLKPLTLSEEDARELLDELGSDKPAIWKSAFDELDYLDPRLAIPMTKLMDEVRDNPRRQRLVAVLSDRPAESFDGKEIVFRHFGKGDSYNFYIEKYGSWWAEVNVSRIGAGGWNSKPPWTRAVRAIVLLQHIGTPEAIAIVKDMAGGHPDAMPTKVAKEALGEKVSTAPSNP